MSLIELLQAGRIEEFNSKRGHRVTLDLFGADLAGLDLHDVDLNGANLEKADLSTANLTGATLAKADLTGADLTGATLDKAVAIKARLREAYLGDARAVDAEFGGADLSEADLTGIHAPRARFGAARLREAVLSRAILTGASFNEARLTEADLRGADLRDAVLRDADLAKANLEGACLEGADLTGARLGGATLRFAKLTGARLTNADLTGANFTGAELDEVDLTGADLTDCQIDLESTGLVDVPVVASAGELHFDDPAIAAVGSRIAVVWENAEEDESVRLLALVGDTKGAAEPVALPVNAEQVVARTILPLDGGFAAVLFAEKPGGVDLVVVPVTTTGTVGVAKAVRLGYAPVVKPCFEADGDGFFVYGIGRQGALSVHRYADGVLTEKLRAPAGTYRGFCGRADPVLLGKGGTVTGVRPDGIGKLLTAPTGYPGRLTAAALRPTDGAVALAWAGRGDKGVRFLRVGADTDALVADPSSEAGAVDLASAGDRWLLVWTREPASDRDLALPYAAWIGKTGPIGKAFVLLSGDDADDVEDVRMVAGGTRPMVAITTVGGGMIVVSVGEASADVACRLG